MGLLILDEAHRLKGGDCVQVNECVARDRGAAEIVSDRNTRAKFVDDLRSLELSERRAGKCNESTEGGPSHKNAEKVCTRESLNLPPFENVSCTAALQLHKDASTRNRAATPSRGSTGQGICCPLCTLLTMRRKTTSQV